MIKTMSAEEALKEVEKGKRVSYKGHLFELAQSGSCKWLEFERYYKDGSHSTCVWTDEDGELEVDVLEG